MSLQSLSDELREVKASRDKWRSIAKDMRVKVEEVVSRLDAEIEGLREALASIATARQDADDWEHPNFDWKLISTKQERIARKALGLPL